MNNFDKNIKKKLYNSQMPVSDGLWASIESQIPVKKEQPKYWLLFLLGACAISLGLFTIDIEKGENITQQSAGIELDNTEKQDQSNKSITKVVAEKVLDRTKVTGLSEDRLSVSSLIQGKKTIGPFKGNTTGNLLKNNKPLVGTNKSIPSLNSTKKLKFLKNPFNTISNNSSSKSVFKLIEKSRIYKSAEPLNSLAQLQENFYKKGISNDEPIDLSAKLLIEKYSVAACPSFEPYSSGLYFYADITSGFSLQQLDNTNPEYSELRAIRERKERGALSISANVGVGKQWANGFLLETGLNYDKISVNTERYADEMPDRLMITIDSIFTSNGWEITRDSSYVAYDNDGKNRNSFSQFNIPVVFGYESLITDRISLISKAGVLINIASRNKGHVSNTDGELIAYDSANVHSSMFKTNMGIAYTGSLLVQSELTPLLAAYTGINVSYYPDNFSLSSNPIKQTYTKVGLSAGLKYRL